MILANSLDPDHPSLMMSLYGMLKGLNELGFIMAGLIINRESYMSAHLLLNL